MKIETLKERIEKKEAQIEKKANTINKKYTQITKKEEKVSKLGYDPKGDKYQAYGTDDHSEVYWTMCDIESLIADIKRLGNEIKEAQNTLAKYNAQLAGELEKEATFINEVPEELKKMEAELKQRIIEHDTERREWLKKEANELGYTDFIKKHSYSAWEERYITDEQIDNTAQKEARAFTLDLLNRVKAITGTITDWSGIHMTMGNGYPVLNGFVKGKEGRCEVESILAGGYNIQRLHIRTLVKAF